MGMRNIQAFCDKWIGKFTDENTNYLELIERYMGDECAELGFEMDCGHAFTEVYGEAATKHVALERIISQVDDIPLLGSAIFSQWRYFTHWAYTGAEILEPENRAWFITALTRLRELAIICMNDMQ